MKYRGYKKGVLRVIAAILAVSMVFSNEMAICSVAYTSYEVGGAVRLLQSVQNRTNFLFLMILR